jgi:prephenate dehydrogenase
MKIAIIGGTGQMGEWFSRFFKNSGYDVTISGRKYKKSIEVSRKLGVKAVRGNVEAVKNADVILISVLPQHMEDVLKEISPHIRENQKVIDIASVKEVPVKLMHSYIKNAVVLGTHPMFGPSAKKENQNFILTPTNSKERKYASEFGSFLKKQGFSVRVMSPEEHDAMIGEVLSLTHFIGLVTADAWKRMGVDKHMKTSSTSFRFLSDFVKSVVDSNPGLYSYLQMDVKDAEKAERLFIDSANQWVEMVRKKRREEFSSRMTDLSRYVERIQKNWK